MSKNKSIQSFLLPGFILCLLAFISVDISSNAQNSSASQNVPVAYHPKKLVNRMELLAGGSFIYPKEKYDENRVAKFGYTVGLNLAHDFGTSPLALNIKLAYEQKGWNSITYSPNTDFSPPATQKFQRSETLNYLTSSVFISHKFNRSLHNLSLGLGGYAGYLVNERMKYRLYFNDSLVSNFKGKPDPDLSYKRIDAGIIAVITYKLQMRKRGLILQIENSQGLIDISQEENSAIKNRTYSLIIGIVFN